MKRVETTVQTKYDVDKQNKILSQTMTFKGGEKYLHNPAFLIHKKIEDKIIQSNIADNRNIFFKDMVRKEDSVIIYYKINDIFDDTLFHTTYHKIVCDIPDNMGCSNCSFLKKGKGVISCSFQDDKILVEYLNSCKFFMQKKFVRS